MSKSLSFLATSAITLAVVINNDDSDIFGSCSNILYGDSGIVFVSQDTPTISERIIKDIDLEMDALNQQTQKYFSASAEQLKRLLVNESIKNTPDVVMFNKGYVGLVWETMADESVFVYSIPDGTLFFNKVGINFSETRILEANKKHFSALIRNINAIV